MDETLNLLYEAWTVISNAPDGWKEDSEWRKAAEAWRDRYHNYINDNDME